MAIDLFSVLGLERSPGIELGDIRAKYLELMQLSHPDAAGAGSASTSPEIINLAYKVLSSDISRIKHLLELEDIKIDSKALESPEVKAKHQFYLEVMEEIAEQEDVNVIEEKSARIAENISELVSEFAKLWNRQNKIAAVNVFYQINYQSRLQQFAENKVKKLKSKIR